MVNIVSLHPSFVEILAGNIANVCSARSIPRFIGRMVSREHWPRYSTASVRRPLTLLIYNVLVNWGMSSCFL